MAKHHKSSSTPKVPLASAPSPREVEELAFELWLQRGSPVGSPEQDWFAAEEKLRARQSESPRPLTFAAGSSDTGS